MSVTRRASGNERTPGNVYVLHKEGPPLVSPFCFRAALALAPSSPCSLRHVLPLMYPTHREPTMRRDPCTTRPKSPRCLPACLLACLPACLPCLPCLLVYLPPACLRRASGSLRENRAFVGHIGGYEERPRRACC